MRISHPLLALLLTATLPVASVAAEQARNQKSTAPVTVGDFAVMLAKVSGNGRAVEIKSAADALRKSGVPLGDPKATLSEEKLAEILGHYGVKVTTSSPQQTVSRAKAEQALLLIGSSLTSSSVAASGTDRKSTRLNSSHGYISYAVFCLKKKKKKKQQHEISIKNTEQCRSTHAEL